MLLSPFTRGAATDAAEAQVIQQQQQSAEAATREEKKIAVEQWRQSQGNLNLRPPVCSFKVSRSIYGLYTEREKETKANCRNLKS